MSAPQYELVDKGDCWAAVRDDTDVIDTWDRGADPLAPNHGLLAQMAFMIEQRWGRAPHWVRTDSGWRAT